MAANLVVLLRRAAWALLACVVVLVPSYSQTRMDLRENWYLQSSCRVRTPGEILSTSQFTPDHWIKTTVPSTVLAAQVANGEFKDIFFGDNLRKIPGMGHAGGADNPYACSWWYRITFELPQDFKGRKVWLHFNGINNRANIWLNGKRLADTNSVAGAYRIYEFDASALADQSGVNVLAVEVFAPTDKDFPISFVDWMPTPPDKAMGLWRGVQLTASGPVRVRYPEVITHFPGKTLDRADLTVRAELHNDSDVPVTGMLRGGFEKVTIAKAVTLAPRESRSVTFTPGEFPQLKVRHPELWWPAGLGAQTLHRLAMAFETAGVVSDAQTVKFGIREITGELYGAKPQMGELFDNNSNSTRIVTDKRPLLIRVNRQPIMIRAGGWAPDMLLREPPERLGAELDYVRDMHLNAIRLEGKLESDALFDLADEKGILVLAGWCCCDHWEHWDQWTPADLDIATQSLRAQILRLRSHASLALWMNGSDHHPTPSVEEAYRKIVAEAGWPNAVISSASSTPSTVSGASGVKMTGPYDYVPPSYWEMDKDNFGGAFGFNTETSPGAAITVKSSLEKFLPADRLWPQNDLWDFHSGAGESNKLGHFNASMAAMYGQPTSLDDYLRKAQAMAYDGERAMFEAYDRNKYTSTGVVQWMLNNGWPSVMWHLYDYYLQPGGGYFGTKKAGEPVHIQYSYDDHSIVVVNNVNRNFRNLTAEASLYDFNLRRLFFRKVQISSAADSVQKLFDLPSEGIDTEVYFVRLALTDKAGKVVSTNFYWLPKTPSLMDWSVEGERKHPYYSAVTRYEDLSLLNRLEMVRLETSATVHRRPDGEDVRVVVRNPSHSLAFQVHLAVVDKNSGNEVLPVLWEDNYVSLMPGESRTIVAHLGSRTSDLKLNVDGWNINAASAGVVGSGGGNDGKAAGEPTR